MNYKKLKIPTPIGQLKDNTRFKFDDGERIGHFKDGKAFVNGIEYGSDTVTLGAPFARLTSNLQYVCYPLVFNKACCASYSRKFHRDRLDRRERRRKKKGERMKDRYQERRRYRPCDLGCGGEMSWCSCCEMYSNNCCVPYGTCQCS